jgi:phosphatidylglycerophosphate synthase
MLDGLAKRAIEPALDRIGLAAARRGVSANAVSIAGFALGLAAALAIVTGQFAAALLLVVMSRALDGLDGAVARATRATDFGGYLDIVLDFAFYGLIPFAFVLHAPAENGVAGALLILSFYVNGASFLAYAAIAEKRALTTTARGVKSFYFTTGLAEASETLIVFVLFCLFPAWFAATAYVFAAICFYTALSRIVLAARAFG